MSSNPFETTTEIVVGVLQTHRWVWSLRIREEGTYVEDGMAMMPFTIGYKTVYGSDLRARKVAERVLQKYTKKKQRDDDRKANVFNVRNAK